MNSSLSDADISWRSAWTSNRRREQPQQPASHTTLCRGVPADEVLVLEVFVGKGGVSARIVALEIAYKHHKITPHFVHGHPLVGACGASLHLPFAQLLA